MTAQKDTDLWKTACAAIHEVDNLTGEAREKYLQSAKIIPPSIPLGQGAMVFTTEEGLNAIRSLGDRWRSADKSRQARIGADRMPQVAINEFGRMLSANGVTLWAPEAYEVEVREFKARLEAALANISRDTVHYFPCHVVKSPQASAFAVGPVRFVRRADWLDHVTATAGRALGWVELVRNCWQGAAAAPTTKDHDGLNARTVIETFQTAWIAIVTVSGNELARSEERAAYAVRLAMDALALPLRRDLALDMRGPGDELRVTRTARVSQFHGLDLNTGSTLDMPDLFSHPPHAEEFLTHTSALRENAGWAIEAILREGTDLSGLKRRWCDALYWYGDARRDRTGFAALVRYGMSLDVLAKGGKADGITKMTSDLFGCTTNTPIMTDGTTLKSAIKAIYNEGRSQFGHGGRPALLEDLPFSREAADHLVRLVLEGHLRNLRRYSGPDDADAFLRAIPSLAVSADAI